MKSIRELTEEEAKSILKECVDHDDWVYSKLSFDPVIDKDGHQQVTFSGDSIVGIIYKSGPNYDSCLKSFNDLKVMKWLAIHNYDISELFDQRISGEAEDEKYRDKFFEERDEMVKEISRKKDLISDMWDILDYTSGALEFCSLEEFEKTVDRIDKELKLE